MRRLKLRPELGHHPLWDISEQPPRPIDPGSLAIDEALRQRLKAWSDLYLKEECRRRTRSSLAMTVRLLAEGEALARALSSTLGPQVQLVLDLPEHAL